MKRYSSLLLLVILTLLLAACATAATPAAPTSEPAPAATEPAEVTELWYDPADVDETWYNICTEEAPRYGGTLITNGANPAYYGGFNVFARGSAKDDYIFNQLYDVGVDGETISPDLATDWAVSDDGLVYTFHLRDDVKFHDGEQFAADDVVATIMAYLHPDAGNPYGRRLALDSILGAEEFIALETDEIEGLTVLDDFTLEVTLAAPRSDFFYKLRGVDIHPKHILDQYEYSELQESPQAQAAPIGTGPFTLGEVVPEQYYTMVANEDYYAGRPYLDSIIFRIGLSGATAMAALEAGEIHVNSTSSRDDYVRAMDNSELVLVGGPLGGGLTIWSNLDRERWQDTRVRNALVMAVDRQAIVDALYDNLGVVLPTYLVGPEANPDLEAIPYDPEQALQLLEDAGWDFDYEAQFLSYYTDDFSKRLIAAMQQYWGDIGIKVNLNYMDSTTWVQMVYADYEFDLSFGCCGWVHISQARGATCDQFYPAGYNVSRYCNQEYDDLLETALTAAPEEALAASYEAQRIFHEEQGYQPMFWPLRFHVVDKNVCGYQNHQIAEPNNEEFPNLWYLVE